MTTVDQIYDTYQAKVDRINAAFDEATEEANYAWDNRWNSGPDDPQKFREFQLVHTAAAKVRDTALEILAEERNAALMALVEDK